MIEAAQADFNLEEVLLLLAKANVDKDVFWAFSGGSAVDPQVIRGEPRKFLCRRLQPRPVY